MDFDYLMVGTATAECVPAAQLTIDPEAPVTLLDIRGPCDDGLA